MTSSPLSTAAVVTVSYNSSSTLSAFLESLASSTAPISQVTVVDNRSADVDAIRRICESRGATLVESPENLGYGGAVNLGVRTLVKTVDRVLISNPDVLVDPETISALSRVLERDERIGAVGPLVKNEDGSVYPSARNLPSLQTGVGHALFSRLWPANPWTARYRADRTPTLLDREAGWLSGSCLMVRRSAFESVGGFDESFFMYFEDVDLGYRLGKRGWLNVYHPAVAVVHSGAESTKSQPIRMVRAHHASAVRYLDRRYPGALLTPLRWFLRGGLRLREALEVNRLRRGS